MEESTEARKERLRAMREVAAATTTTTAQNNETGTVFIPAPFSLETEVAPPPSNFGFYSNPIAAYTRGGQNRPFSPVAASSSGFYSATGQNKRKVFEPNYIPQQDQFVLGRGRGRGFNRGGRRGWGRGRSGPPRQSQDNPFEDPWEGLVPRPLPD